MFTLPNAIGNGVDEFASTSAADIKAAIDAAIAELPSRRAHEVDACVGLGDLAGAAVTREQYVGAERVLRKIASILGYTILHGGTGKPVSAVKTTDYELPEMFSRPVAPAAPAAAPPSVPMPAPAPAAAASASGGKRRKVS